MRTKPYTALGIRRLKCVKCGEQAEHQWRICSTGKWTPVCKGCDLEINRKVAEWAFGKSAARPLIAKYKATYL